MTPGQIQQQIQEALEDAFRNYANLEQMLRDQLNDRLEKYSDRTHGITDTVYKLIQEYDRRSMLDDLVLAAIRANNNNSYLQKLNEIINDIDCAANSHNLSHDFHYLSLILQDIEFDIIKPVLIEVLSARIEKSSLLKIFQDVQSEDFTESKSRKTIKNFILKKLLLVDYEELKDGTKNIVKFSQSLAKKTDTGLIEATRKRLNDWVKKIVGKYKFNCPEYSEYQSSGELHSYLLIIIKPENSQYRINAYLIPNEEDKDKIEPVDIESEEKGFVCCNFDEIETKIPDFIKTAFKIIDLYKRTRRNRHCQLTIQFFLPIEHLNQTVEKWKLAQDLDLLMGDEYRVVVRSYERVRNPEMSNHLIAGIRRLEAVRREIKSPMTEDVCEHLFEHLKEKELDTLNWKSLRNKLQENKIGLKLYCSLPPVTNKYKKLYEAILRSGTPIVIWKRNSSLLDHEFQNFLKIRSLENCHTFFELLLEIRKTAYASAENPEDYLGYHLGVLYEEPNLEDFPDLKAAIESL